MTAMTAEIFDGALQGTAFAISSNFLVTVGHMGADNSCVKVQVGNDVMYGTVVIVPTGAPHAPTETVASVANDWEIILLDKPQHDMTILHFGSVVDGEAVTSYGFSSVTLGNQHVALNQQVITHSTVELTQIPYVLAQTTPETEGASGSPVLDASGAVIGIVAASGMGYEFLAGISPLLSLIGNILAN